MPTRFQKRKTIVPGVNLNIGKRGVSSVRLGKRRGAGVTVGKRGAHANVGIPGTGLSYRAKIAGGKKKGASAQRQVNAPATSDVSDVSTVPIAAGVTTFFVSLVVIWVISSFVPAIITALVLSILVAVVMKLASSTEVNNGEKAANQSNKAIVAEERFNAQMNAPTQIKQIDDCIRILQSTTNPSVFFERLDFLIEQATALASAQAAGHVKLNIDIAKYLPTEIEINELISEFINRAYAKMLEGCENLKMESAKTKRAISFFETLSLYADKVNTNNAVLINELRGNHGLGEEGVEGLAKHYDSMSGHEFERFCVDLLLQNGFAKAEGTSGSGDHGVDILAEKDGITYAIQCKRQSSNVGNKAVQEVYSGRTFYGMNVGAVLTNQYFTPAAKEAAERTGVILWDKEWLEQAASTTSEPQL